MGVVPESQNMCTVGGNRLFRLSIRIAPIFFHWNIGLAILPSEIVSCNLGIRNVVVLRSEIGEVISTVTAQVISDEF